MDKKCFVISPIGAEDSAIRKHADDVFETIIAPALKKCNVAAIRADHMEDPGKITHQMIQAILEYEMCLAVLTDHNPNVFYELAVAQSAARPVVLLLEKDQKIPFDIQDFRVIKYDLEPRNIYNETWVGLVEAQVKKVLSSNYQPEGLLKKGKLIESSDAHRYWLSGTSKDFGDAPRFEDIVSQATTKCDLLGISLESWAKKSSSETILKIAETGCKVRILIMSEKNLALEHLINDQLPAQNAATLKQEIREIFNHFADLSQKNPRIEVRQLHTGLAHFQLILTDREALCLQYLYSRSGGESPLFGYPAASPLYDAVLDEFDTLWALNTASNP